jgi:hypothetical protein
VPDSTRLVEGHTLTQGTNLAHRVLNSTTAPPSPAAAAAVTATAALMRLNKGLVVHAAVMKEHGLYKLL